MSPARLLIVDDDPELRHFLTTELKGEGYDCNEAATGQQALGKIRNESWDLVLLDWTLPDFSGVEVCRRMRQGGIGTPVLMITARDEVRERVEALDSGADDYLTKPFSIEELLARVRARLRRSGLNESDDGVLRIGDLSVNTASREVNRGGRSIHLTAREFDLLLYLLRQPQHTCQRQRLQLVAIQPAVLLAEGPDLIAERLQHLAAHLAHLQAPALPGLHQIVVKALSLLPFGSMQPDHFFICQ